MGAPHPFLKKHYSPLISTFALEINLSCPTLLVSAPFLRLNCYPGGGGLGRGNLSPTALGNGLEVAWQVKRQEALWAVLSLEVLLQLCSARGRGNGIEKNTLCVLEAERTVNGSRDIASLFLCLQK